MGIINIGGNGTVTVDGKEYNFKYKDGMYIGMGAKDISLRVKILRIQLSFILTVHQHIRHILQYLLIQLRIFYLRTRKNLDVLKVQTIELLTSIFFLDRLKVVS